MTEKKYVVPYGMLRAAADADMLSIEHSPESELAPIRLHLEAALRWLAENPIVPTSQDQADLLSTWRRNDKACGYPTNGVAEMTAEWQRRMFLAPDPVVPEEIKDLLCGLPSSDNLILEAYRRGQESK